jgi:hypothetical protein
MREIVRGSAGTIYGVDGVSPSLSGQSYAA